MFKRVTSLLIVLVFVLTMIGTAALAGNVCKQVWGDARWTTTFTIDTGSRWLLSDRITFKQTEGILIYEDALYNTKKERTYAKYYVYYTKKGGTQQMKKWTGEKLELKLDKNSSYTVKVVPQSMYVPVLKNSPKWDLSATWRVTNTKGINFCA